MRNAAAAVELVERHVADDEALVRLGASRGVARRDNDCTASRRARARAFVGQVLRLVHAVRTGIRRAGRPPAAR